MADPFVVARNRFHQNQPLTEQDKSLLARAGLRPRGASGPGPGPQLGRQPPVQTRPPPDTVDLSNLAPRQDAGGPPSRPPPSSSIGAVRAEAAEAKADPGYVRSERPCEQVPDASVFLDKDRRGDPRTPLALDLDRGGLVARGGGGAGAPMDGPHMTIMHAALGSENPDKYDASRVAWTATTLGATSSDFLVTHSLTPCQPVVVFWKSPGSDEQKATLFHFNGREEEEFLSKRLNRIDPNMRIDSINYIPRSYNERQKTFKDLYCDDLSALAKSRGAPLNILPSSVAGPMAIAVDVRGCKIVAMDSPDHPLYPTHRFPTPKRLVDCL